MPPSLVMAGTRDGVLRYEEALPVYEGKADKAARDPGGAGHYAAFSDMCRLIPVFEDCKEDKGFSRLPWARPSPSTSTAWLGWQFKGEEVKASVGTRSAPGVSCADPGGGDAVDVGALGARLYCVAGRHVGGHRCPRGSSGMPVEAHDPLELVDPFVGTGGNGAEIANVNPVASTPFGMTLVGPDTRTVAGTQLLPLRGYR